MTQCEGAVTIETAGVRTTGRQGLGDAFNRCQIGWLIIEAKFASYALSLIHI